MEGIWIRTQNRKELWCATKFWIEVYFSEDFEEIEKAALKAGLDDYRIIGTYSTEQRAFEVLNEIQKAIENGQKVFEMPEA